MDSEIAENKSTYDFKIKENGEIKKEFSVSSDRSSGSWVFTNGFDNLEDVVCSNKKGQQISEGKKSDDTIEICLPKDYLLTIEKTS